MFSLFDPLVELGFCCWPLLLPPQFPRPRQVEVPILGITFLRHFKIMLVVRIPQRSTNLSSQQPCFAIETEGGSLLLEHLVAVCIHNFCLNVARSGVEKSKDFIHIR